MSIPALPLKDLAKLTRKHFRDETGLFLIEGKKIISEALQSGAEIQQILVTGKFLHEHTEFLTQHHLTSRDVTVIADHNAQRLSETKTPPGIFAVVVKPDTSLEDLKKNSFLVAFEDVRDPNNMGTMIRTADWFGVKGILVSDQGVDPYNDKVLRGAMGSTFHTTVVTSLDFASDLEELKAAGYQIIVSRPESPSHQNPIIQAGQKVCLVLGNESLGTSAAVDQLADSTYSIPRRGNAESLNVSVSFGIMLNELTK